MEKEVSFGQFRKLLELMEQRGMTAQRFQRLLDTGILADIFDPAASLDDRGAVRSAIKLPQLASPTFCLSVDYNSSFVQMIAAARLNWVHGEITAKRFPIVGVGVLEFEARYFHFNRKITSEDAIKEIETADTANPWMPAKLEHMLSHGKTFPDEQCKYPIVGLGSVAEVSGNRFVPYLSRGGSGRDLDLDWFGRGWGRRCRFLAVCKVSGA